MILRAREAGLRDTLFTMRAMIDRFTLDNKRPPESLDELVEKGYLGDIPIDPLTRSKETWRVAGSHGQGFSDRGHLGMIFLGGLPCSSPAKYGPNLLRDGEPASPGGAFPGLRVSTAYRCSGDFTAADFPAVRLCANAGSLARVAVGGTSADHRPGDSRREEGFCPQAA
jgi:hypothetical protein